MTNKVIIVVESFMAKFVAKMQVLKWQTEKKICGMTTAKITSDESTGQYK